MKFIVYFLFILLLSLQVNAFHQVPKNEDKTTTSQPNILENFLMTTGDYLEYIYIGVNTTSKGLDEFITNETSPYIYDDSYVNIKFSYEYFNKRANTKDADVDIKLKLPLAKKRFKLILENSENKVNENEENIDETVPYKDDDFNFAVEYDTFKENINLKANIGVKTSVHPDLFAKAKASKTYNIYKNINLEIKEELKQSVRDDFSNTTAIRFIKPINDTSTLTNHNEYFWNSKVHVDYLYNSIYLYQRYSQKDIFNYIISMNSNNNASNFKPKSYNFHVTYRHYIKHWLYYEVIPKIFFPIESNFKDEYALRFNFGILIRKNEER